MRRRRWIAAAISVRGAEILVKTTTPAKAGATEWIGLGVTAVPCLIYAMDLTILHLALPTIAADFQPGPAQLLWMVDIYGFMVAGFLITMGTLGDRIGRRKLLLIGAGMFAVTSAFAAFATSAPMLILARGLLGIAGATLAPSTLSLIRNMFLDDRERTFAIGVWVACFSAGAALGPLVGGALLSVFSWGSVFLINVPFMLALIVLGPMFLPEFRDPNAGRLDLTSALMSLIAVLSVIYGLKQMAEGTAGALVALPIVLGVFVSVLFVRRQFTSSEPLLDLALLRSRSLAATLFINVLCIFVAFGVFFFIAQYFQLVLGLKPLMAGLWTAPGGLASVAGSMMVSPLVRYARPAHAIAGCFVLAALALGLLSQAGGPGDFWLILTGYVLMAFAFGPLGALTTDLVMTSVPPSKAGAASGISETSFEFGAALGIALLGSLILALYGQSMEAAFAAGLVADPAAAARDTLSGAVALAERLPEAEAQRLLSIARGAYVEAFAVASALCALMAVAGAVIAFTVLDKMGPNAAIKAIR
jgi:MFS transporter, DHA2 family, multidrug resistance protein